LRPSEAGAISYGLLLSHNDRAQLSALSGVQA
jgi:hypothetical protein